MKSPEFGFLTTIAHWRDWARPQYALSIVSHPTGPPRQIIDNLSGRMMPGFGLRELAPAFLPLTRQRWNLRRAESRRAKAATSTRRSENNSSRNLAIAQYVKGITDE